MPRLKGVRMSTGPTFVVEGEGEQTFGPDQTARHYNYPALPLLVADIQLYLDRRGIYGESERDFADVMSMLFPKGLMLVTNSDWVRYGLLHHVVGKLVRYANNFTEGGHPDSLRDMRVYLAMLQAEDER